MRLAREHGKARGVRPWVALEDENGHATAGALAILGASQLLRVTTVAALAVATLFFGPDVVLSMPLLEWSAGTWIVGTLILSEIAYVAVTLGLSRQSQAVAAAAPVAPVARDFDTVVAQAFDRWGLSRAERAIALMAIKGYSNADIARMRTTVEATVKSQLNAVYRKAGVSGRNQLLADLLDEMVGKTGQAGERVRVETCP